MHQLPLSVRSFHHAFIAVAATGAAWLAGCEQSAQPKPPTPIQSPSTAMAQSAPSATSAASAGGSAAAPPSGVDATTARLSTADSDGSRVEIAGLVLPKPPAWTWQAPTMAFRTLQYAVPADGSGGAAELVFSIFRKGDGGPVDQNIERWKQQFRGADGQAAPMTQREVMVSGIPVILMRFEGAYQGVGAAAPRPGMAQLGAIIQLANANVFVRLVGPAATVSASERAFDGMIEGMKPSTDG